MSSDSSTSYNIFETHVVDAVSCCSQDPDSLGIKAAEVSEAFLNQEEIIKPPSPLEAFSNQEETVKPPSPISDTMICGDQN